MDSCRSDPYNGGAWYGNDASTGFGYGQQYYYWQPQYKGKGKNITGKGKGKAYWAIEHGPDEGNVSNESPSTASDIEEFRQRIPAKKTKITKTTKKDNKKRKKSNSSNSGFRDAKEKKQHNVNKKTKIKTTASVKNDNAKAIDKDTDEASVQMIQATEIPEDNQLSKLILNANANDNMSCFLECVTWGLSDKMFLENENFQRIMDPATSHLMRRPGLGAQTQNLLCFAFGIYNL